MKVSEISAGNLVERLYCQCEGDVCSYLKCLEIIFFTGEGNNKEIVKLYNGMKICWGINSKLEKYFQNSKALFCKLFTARGGMCSPI